MTEAYEVPKCPTCRRFHFPSEPHGADHEQAVALGRKFSEPRDGDTRMLLNHPQHAWFTELAKIYSALTDEVAAQQSKFAKLDFVAYWEGTYLVELPLESMTEADLRKIAATTIAHLMQVNEQAHRDAAADAPTNPK